MIFTDLARIYYQNKNHLCRAASSFQERVYDHVLLLAPGYVHTDLSMHCSAKGRHAFRQLLLSCLDIQCPLFFDPCILYSSCLNPKDNMIIWLPDMLTLLSRWQNELMYLWINRQMKLVCLAISPCLQYSLGHEPCLPQWDICQCDPGGCLRNTFTWGLVSSRCSLQSTQTLRDLIQSSLLKKDTWPDVGWHVNEVSKANQPANHQICKTSYSIP